MAMTRILGGGGGKSEEEVLRVRAQFENEAALKKAASALERVKAETEELEGAFDRGAVAADQYKLRLTQLTAEHENLTKEQKKLEAVHKKLAEGEKLRASGLFYLARAARSAATGGSPMTVANNVFFATRSAGGVGELAKQMTNLAKSGPAALAGLAAGAPAATAAIVATGGALLMLNKGLKDAELGWGDLGRIISNTTPWQVATEAIRGVGVALEEAGNKGAWIGGAALGPLGAVTGMAIDAVAGSSIDNKGAAIGGGLLGPLGALTGGAIDASISAIASEWGGATEAAKAHNEEVARTTAFLKEAEVAQKKLTTLRSEEQKKATEGGARFGDFVANLGGAGGMDAVMGQLVAAASGKGGDEEITRGGETKTRKEWAELDMAKLMADAIGGDRMAAGRITQMLGAQGHDVGGLEQFAFGDEMHLLPGDEEHGIVDQIVGPTRQTMVEGLKEEEQREKDFDRLREQANKATAEARKVSTEAAFGGILAVGGRADRGILDSLLGGGNMDSAMSSVTDALAHELESSGGLPTKWAEEEAKKYVDERAKAMKDKAVNEMLDPEARELERLGILRQQMDMAEMARGGPLSAPGTFDAGSFAQSVQSGGGQTFEDIAKNQLDEMIALVKLNQDIKRVLERGGLLGS